MTMQINDLGDGRYELVEIRAVSIGVLTDRRIAERFADYLDQAEEIERRQAETQGAATEPVEPVVSEARPAEAYLAGAALKAEPAPEDARITNDGPERETPLQEAFRRLEAGEKLGAVADDLGMPMPRLRGLWARRKKAVEEVAIEGAVAAGQMECATCGRGFRPGSDGGDTCARCSREIGRA